LNSTRPVRDDPLGISARSICDHRVRWHTSLNAPLSKSRSDVGVKGIHQHIIRFDHVAGLFGSAKSLSVDQ
jgi:hypothetical protein